MHRYGFKSASRITVNRWFYELVSLNGECFAGAAVNGRHVCHGLDRSLLAPPDHVKIGLIEPMFYRSINTHNDHADQHISQQNWLIHTPILINTRSLHTNRDHIPTQINTHGDIGPHNTATLINIDWYRLNYTSTSINTHSGRSIRNQYTLQRWSIHTAISINAHNNIDQCTKRHWSAYISNQYTLPHLSVHAATQRQINIYTDID